MSSPCRNPDRWAAAAQLLPFALVAVLAVASTNASAQQDAAPAAQHGPNEVFVTGLFPNGGTPPPKDPIGARFEGNNLAIAAGKQLFGEMNCTGCHFNGGGGMGPALMSGHWHTARRGRPPGRQRSRLQLHRRPQEARRHLGPRHSRQVPRQSPRDGAGYIDGLCWTEERCRARRSDRLSRNAQMSDGRSGLMPRRLGPLHRRILARLAAYTFQVGVAVKA
jgi:hypothetical protein